MAVHSPSLESFRTKRAPRSDKGDRGAEKSPNDFRRDGLVWRRSDKLVLCEASPILQHAHCTAARRKKKKATRFLRSSSDEKGCCWCLVRRRGANVAQEMNSSASARWICEHITQQHPGRRVRREWLAGRS